MEPLKRLPVDVGDFKKMRENCYFVGKARFVKEILDNCGDATLITQPCCFGKSMSMSRIDLVYLMKIVKVIISGRGAY